MKFQNTYAMNFEGAFRGLRNPLQSWNKSDSYFGIINIEYDTYCIDDTISAWVKNELEHRQLVEGQQPIEQGSIQWDQLFDKYFTKWYKNSGIIRRQNDDIIDVACIGPHDMDLAHRMIKAGSSDRKFLRQIMVSVDITAPLYFWKQFDTYKIATVANSTSTMHKLASTSITKDCFEMDDFNENEMFYKDNVYNPDMTFGHYWDMLINDLEYLRNKYNKTKDKKYWKELIRLLPESWLQTRTVTMNYEVLRNIYSQRRYHKLTEWHIFCDWIKTLPYAKDLIIYNID